jgi:hypothetical protein
MATITIKIDSEDLARDVLTHLGYLPEDDPEIPDLVSSEDEDEPEEEPEEEAASQKELDAYVEKRLKEDEEDAIITIVSANPSFWKNTEPLNEGVEVEPMEKDVGAPINDETV